MLRRSAGTPVKTPTVDPCLLSPDPHSRVVERDKQTRDRDLVLIAWCGIPILPPDWLPE